MSTSARVLVILLSWLIKKYMLNIRNEKGDTSTYHLVGNKHNNIKYSLKKCETYTL